VVGEFSPFVSFDRESWSRLRAATPLTLSEDDLAQLQGINEYVSLDQVADIYLPLSRLLNLHVAASHDLYRATDAFLGQPVAKVPYVIGLAGSVAVGKSTTARILQALLARWPDHPRVDLVTTDGFLFPNAVLEDRGLMGRKGFPESYDVAALIRFIAEVKSGRDVVSAPVYSHLTYDIVEGEHIEVAQPDIMIIEGLNVLQTGGGDGRTASVFVSDFFDFSIYVDAEEEHVTQWYVDRFLALRSSAFQDPTSFFHRFASLTDDEAVALARSIWDDINGRNLKENIAPTRDRATLILEKGADHSVQRVHLRRM
jgi:type I pantothenate kinase